MRRFLILAFRNVFRNRRRTLMTLVIVSGGVTALLLAGGFFALLFEGIRESTIQNGLGHLQVLIEYLGFVPKALPDKLFHQGRSERF